MIRPSDIIPVSEVQARLPSLIKQTRMSKCPIVVTQRGRATAALIDIEEYERLQMLAELAIAELEQRNEEAKHDSISSEEFRDFLREYMTDR